MSSIPRKVEVEFLVKCGMYEPGKRYEIEEGPAKVLEERGHARIIKDKKDKQMRPGKGMDYVVK